MKHLITSLRPAFSVWRVKLASLALIGVAALFCLAAASSPPPERGLPRLHKLTGAWSVQTAVELQQATFPALITFTSDGIVLGDEPPSPFETTAHGNWIATGPTEAAFTFLAIVGGGPDGPMVAMNYKVVGALQYDDRTDTWGGPFKIRISDGEGNEIITDRGTFTGTRIAIEPLD